MFLEQQISILECHMIFQKSMKTEVIIQFYIINFI